MDYPIYFQNLIDSFKKLPGVGAKSAERMAYDILSMNKDSREAFANSIKDIDKISHCPCCGNLSADDGLCELCNDDNRNKHLICVVSGPKDVYALEKMKEYNGVYHILNGLISPSKGISYDDINLASLLTRIEKDKEIEEIILATDLTMEGELTAMYISKLLEKYPNVNVTRLAHGLPMGAQLDYADEMTLFKAFSNRKNIKN